MVIINAYHILICMYMDLFKINAIFIFDINKEKKKINKYRR